MKTSTFQVIVLEPEDGFYLTQINTEDELVRTFSKKVFLGQGDSPDNWKQVSQQEKDNYEILQKEQDEKKVIIEEAKQVGENE